MDDGFVRRYIDSSMFKTKKLSPIMKYYRYVGFCYYDNKGQPKLVYKVYCFVMFVLFWILFPSLLSSYSKREYFTWKSTLQRLPFILKQTLRMMHIFFVSVWVLKKNHFIKEFYTCISCIKERIKLTEQEPHSDVFYCRFLSFLHFCFLSIVGCSFIIEMGNNATEKFSLFALIILTFPLYVKEQCLTLTVLTIRNTLISVNQVFRKFQLAAEDIKHLRRIHTQLTALNIQVNDHFRLMITTWIISSTLIIWASGFQIIRSLISVDDPTKYLIVAYSSDALHHLINIMTLCHYCEALKEEVSSDCYLYIYYHTNIFISPANQN